MEPVTALGVAAATIQFIDSGSKFVKRLRELAEIGDVPKAFRDARTRLPLIMSIVNRTQNGLEILDPETKIRPRRCCRKLLWTRSPARWNFTLWESWFINLRHIRYLADLAVWYIRDHGQYKIKDDILHRFALPLPVFPSGFFANPLVFVALFYLEKLLYFHFVAGRSLGATSCTR